MTDFKYATPEQWAQCEEWVENPIVGASDACILELRGRVEALEANMKQWRSDHLRLANTCAGMAKDRLEFFGKLLRDEETTPEGEILDYYSKLAAQHAAKAVFHQDPSLIERVVMAIARDGETARWDEARAAMLEIAKWLESRAGGTRACWLLEREAQK